jgi:hypothetical protein
MSYQVAVQVHGESGPSYNSIYLASEEEATAYAKNLYSRWMLMAGFTIETSKEPVNYQWVDGALKSV